MVIGNETKEVLKIRAEQRREDALFIEAIKKRARYNSGTKTWYPTRSQVIEAFWEVSPELRKPLAESGSLEDSTEYLNENLLPALEEGLDDHDIDVQEDDDD